MNPKFSAPIALPLTSKSTSRADFFLFSFLGCRALIDRNYLQLCVEGNYSSISIGGIHVAVIKELLNSVADAFSNIPR